MAGQHEQPGFHGPNMEVVDIFYPRNRLHHRGDVGSADAGRRRIQQNVQRFSKQGPGAVENDSDDEQTDQRVQNRPSGEHDRSAADDHAE